MYKAILDAAMDAVVTIDHLGRVMEWNIARAAPAGRRRPGQASILDRRVEVQGQHADGTTFPVALTITLVVSTAGVMCSGFLRDISDRHEMLAELKASRSRFVTVSDDARRRVERDLHEGAQQQLVALAIALGSARGVIDTEPTSAAAAGLGPGSVGERHRRTARAGSRYPLTDPERAGPATTIGEQARRSAVPVQASVDLPDRFAELVETTIYYFVAEALNQFCQARCQRALVTAELVQGAPNSLRFTVSATDPGWC